MNLCKDPDLMPRRRRHREGASARAAQSLPAALLGRMTVIPYYPLGDAMLKSIIRLQLTRIEKRLGRQPRR